MDDKELAQLRAAKEAQVVIAEALTFEHFPVPDSLQLAWRRGYAPANAPDLPLIPLEQVDNLALSKLCDQFRAAVFRKAGREDPYITRPRS